MRLPCTLFAGLGSLLAVAAANQHAPLHARHAAPAAAAMLSARGEGGWNEVQQDPGTIVSNIPIRGGQVVSSASAYRILYESCDHVDALRRTLLTVALSFAGTIRSLARWSRLFQAQAHRFRRTRQGTRSMELLGTFNGCLAKGLGTRLGQRRRGWRLGTCLLVPA